MPLTEALETTRSHRIGGHTGGRTIPPHTPG
jgi:hypothetical protein